MKFALRVFLTVSSDGPDEQLTDEVEHVVEHLLDLEGCNEGLLDSAIGLDLSQRSVDVDLTVEAATYGEAIDQGLTYVRTAIHSSGGGTPKWEGGDREGVLAFEIDDRDMRVRRIPVDA